MDRTTTSNQAAVIELTSPGFEEGQMIPVENTCDGHDISPELRWAAFPGGTRSLALIMDDPDAPSGTFVHWVLYNLPIDQRGLTKNVPRDEILPNGARQGVNDFGKVGYSGPCPPSGTHRYYFTLYALDMGLDLAPRASKALLLKAMGNHILAKGQLMGRYARRRTRGC